MNRLEFIKKSAVALVGLPLLSVLAPVVGAAKKPVYTPVNLGYSKDHLNFITKQINNPHITVVMNETTISWSNRVFSFSDVWMRNSFINTLPEFDKDNVHIKSRVKILKRHVLRNEGKEHLVESITLHSIEDMEKPWHQVGFERTASTTVKWKISGKELDNLLATTKFKS